jgi:hypothetical protein
VRRLDALSEHATSGQCAFVAIPGDFGHFLSRDTMNTLCLGGAGALSAHRWDRNGIEESIYGISNYKLGHETRISKY